MLGISVYFSDLDYDYIEYAAKHGAKYIFTSLHIPEEDLSNLDQDLPLFLERCKELNIDLIPDISPLTFEKLKLKNNDIKGLKDLGFKYLRLDFGFEDVNDVVELSNHFKIVLNASTINEQYLIDCQNAGLDLKAMYVMHNFYPKKETGLPLDYFKNLNEIFVRYGFNTMAFVPGDHIKRLPRYEGLPTLEKHRALNPYVSAVELIKTCNITDILIGDNQAHHDTLKYISDYMSNGIMNVPVIMNAGSESMLNEIMEVRNDLSEDLVRLKTQRFPDASIPIKNNNERKKGTITLDNKLAGRYSGEIQIMKHDLPYDPASNIIAWIHPNFTGLIDFMDSDIKIRFIHI